MSDDLNLPASLQRLEITPERSEVTIKPEVNNPFTVLNMANDQPECFLENLSLNAVCSKGNCQCNKKKEDKEKDEVLLKLKKKVKETKQRLVLRRSRLNKMILRPPILRLNASGSLEKTDVSPKPEPLFSASVVRDDVLECSSSQSLASGKSLLRAPVLKIAPHRTLSPHQATTSRCTNDEATAHRQPAMCAVQARNPSPDDTNIEELASYFDLFVYIPKKMSVMAEMMYI